MATLEQRLDRDPKSGFCRSNGVYYSKKDPVPLPPRHQHLSLPAYVLSHHHPTDIAFIDAPSGTRLSYAALRHDVKALAAGLHRLGIRKGNVVLILSPNSIYVPCIYLAVLSLGAIITTANPRNTEGEIQKQVADSNPVIVFAASELIHKARATLLPIVHIHSGNGAPQEDCVSSLHELLQFPVEDAPLVDIDHDDTATLLYSSGTTGKIKGVVATHRNYIATVAATVNGTESYTGSDIYLLIVPLFHAYGFHRTLSSVAIGETVVVMPKFDLAEMLMAIQRYKVTCVPVAPPIFLAFAKSPVVATYDLSSVRDISSSAAPLGKEVIDELKARLPHIEVGQGYGLTECSGAATFMSSSEERKKYGSAGLLASNMEAKIVDTITGKALPPNQRGELWLRGPTVMKGYFGNEEATAIAIDSQGWLKTGDMCYIDEEGFLFVVDRIKEMIKYKGFQVAPAELEELLLSNPEIADAAVIPYPDKETGQIPMAFIVRNSASKLKEEDVMSFVSKQVSPYKKIRRVAFVTLIPKSQSGKILRKDLIKQALYSSKL